MKFKPHKYQERAIREMFEQPELALFLDPGLGKTVCSLTTLIDLKNAGYAKAMLVICPLRPMLSTWPAEILKWDHLKNLRLSILHGPNKDHALEQEADVYLINPEGLSWLYAKLSKFAKYPFDMLVVDESTKFKRTNTQRFKILKKMLPKFESRYILTGTPAPQGFLDLFGQIYLLDQGDRLGKYITRYKEEYFFPTDYMKYKWELKKGSNKKIINKIEDIVIRLSSRDYLELPELSLVDHWIDLPRRARKEYDELALECILKLEEGLVTAGNAAVLSSKLRQVANGGIYLADEEKGKHVSLHYEKADYVSDLIEEMSGQQVLVAYEFKHDLHRIKVTLLRKLGINVNHIGGGVTANKAKEAEDKLNSGESQVLLCQPSSVAFGFNFQAANNVIFHSLPWSLDLYEQLIQRVWRQGQEKRVFVHRILAKNTVDEAVVASLAGKGEVQTSLLESLKKHLGVKQ